LLFCALWGTQPFVKLQNYKKIVTHTKIVTPTPSQAQSSRKAVSIFICRRTEETKGS
jgi:hypothetical protein